MVLTISCGSTCLLVLQILLMYISFKVDNMGSKGYHDINRINDVTIGVFNPFILDPWFHIIMQIVNFYNRLCSLIDNFIDECFVLRETIMLHHPSQFFSNENIQPLVNWRMVRTLHSKNITLLCQVILSTLKSEFDWLEKHPAIKGNKNIINPTC